MTVSTDIYSESPETNTHPDWAHISLSKATLPGDAGWSPKVARGLATTGLAGAHESLRSAACAEDRRDRLSQRCGFGENPLRWVRTEAIVRQDFNRTSK
jgi:hypothetical protein